MNTEGLAQLFYREVEKITDNKVLTKAEKIAGFYRLLNLLFFELTRKEKLHFTTLFARITYASHQFKLEKGLQYYLHHFRRQATSEDKSQLDEDQLFQLGLRVVLEIIFAVLQQPIPAALAASLPLEWPYPFSPVKIKAFKAKARVLILSDDSDYAQLIGRDENHPEELIRIQYNIPIALSILIVIIVPSFL